MDSGNLLILAATAASIGFIHTVLGPDHYLPFIAMSQAGGWSRKKTVIVTLLCGIAHVLSSVALGMVGIALGIAVFRLESVESFRGEIAGWALIAFGLAYFVWGLRQALRGRPHEHAHAHEDGAEHLHTHTHKEHFHVHKKGGKNLTPWVLFTIFVLGPCEPLIPILMYPAAKESLAGVALVTAVFGIVTVSTMLSVVLMGLLGMRRIPTAGLERYGHASAGAAILMCGLATALLGL